MIKVVESRGKSWNLKSSKDYKRLEKAFLSMVLKDLWKVVLLTSAYSLDIFKSF